MTTSDNKSPPTAAKQQDKTTQSNDAKEFTTQSIASTIKSLAPPSSSSSSNEPSTKKKRRSDIQLNKDDHPEGINDDNDDDLNEDGEKRSDPFKKASEEVIKGRKIVKVSKKWDTGTGVGGGGGGGVFGSVALVADSNNNEKKDENAAAPSESETAKVPTFGSAAAKSGFGTFGSGFGVVSNGFGSLKPKSDEKEDDKEREEKDAPKNTFGSGFGASAGFGNVKSTSGFGTCEKEASALTSKTENESGAFTASTTTNEKIVMNSTELNNGEENFDCICEVRAKLHKLLPVEDDDEETEEEKGEKVASVPSTSGRLELKANEKTKGSNDGVGAGKISLSWKEAGIGPVRVLNPKEHLLSKDDETSKLHPRLVQRQESAPGSQGMKVILNVNLNPDVCKVTRTSEKIVQLNAPNVGNDGSGRALESYSLRVKTEEEADKLQDALKKMLASS